MEITSFLWRLEHKRLVHFYQKIIFPKFQGEPKLSPPFNVDIKCDHTYTSFKCSWRVAWRNCNYKHAGQSHKLFAIYAARQNRPLTL